MNLLMLYNVPQYIFLSLIFCLTGLQVNFLNISSFQISGNFIYFYFFTFISKCCTYVFINLFTIVEF